MPTVAPDDFGKIGADLMCRQMGLGLVLLPVGCHCQKIARLLQTRKQRRQRGRLDHDSRLCKLMQQCCDLLRGKIGSEKRGQVVSSLIKRARNSNTIGQKNAPIGIKGQAISEGAK